LRLTSFAVHGFKGFPMHCLTAVFGTVASLQQEGIVRKLTFPFLIDKEARACLFQVQAPAMFKNSNISLCSMFRQTGSDDFWLWTLDWIPINQSPRSSSRPPWRSYRDAGYRLPSTGYWLPATGLRIDYRV